MRPVKLFPDLISAPLAKYNLNLHIVVNVQEDPKANRFQSVARPPTPGMYDAHANPNLWS
jgi:hypothetical protein